MTGLVNELSTAVWIILRSLVLFFAILSTTFYIAKLTEFLARVVRGMSGELTPFTVSIPAVCWTIYIVCFM